ncbi:MAG: MarR family winged helix-turn-helix transcriptional regulator [Candidatus Marsarchaeota archaeon]|jgi:DNA-binding MarR family transcriptional regulator|nr:MarR family winged helix-turn-helix transcriptional regulator [Candidatus Marsarchaeota archaeon]
MLIFMGETESFLFKDKQAKLLIALKSKQGDMNVSALASNTGVTYVHACNFIKRCTEKGIIKSERRGKEKYLSLTEKGVKVADLISAIYTTILEP